MFRIRFVLRRIALFFALLVPLGIGTLALVLSHDSPCAAAGAAPADGTGMKAVVYRCYGGPEVLHIEDVAMPVLADDQLLVRVHAAAVNPLDWHYLHGTPYVMRLDAGIGKPTNSSMGVDFAGTVESVGKDVTRFKPGDAVFGGRTGALAQYVAVRASRAVAAKPERISFEQAAAVPIAAVTALQALRDQGRVQAGQKVLINGASGGVGTFAVQLAKNFGAEVTAVCSTRNLELVRSLGADHVIDYTQEDFTKGSTEYDLIVDMVSTHPLRDYLDVMQPQGRLVIVGGAGGPDEAWIGPMAAPLKAMFLTPFISQEIGFFMAELRQGDLELLGAMMEQGKLTPVIDRTYAFEESAQAIEYLETGRARGKVVVTMELADRAAR